MRSIWKKIRHRIEWAALKAAGAIVPLLSRKTCYHLAQSVGALASVLDRHGRRVAVENLHFAFGGTLTNARREEIVRETYQHFARAMIDLMWSPRLTKENFSRYVEMKNLEVWLDALEPGKPVIFGCYHYSNFEWMGVGVGHLGYPSVLLAQEFKNPFLDPIFTALRESSGHRVVPREGAVLHLYKAVRRGGRVAIFVDVTIPAQLPTVPIECFGLKTSVTQAHAWLHQRTGAPIINAHCEPLPDGRYRVVFHPKLEVRPGATLSEIAQACWDQFELYVREHPAPWMWMYKHWRYRPAAADPASYPFYSNVSPAFEQRLAESESSAGMSTITREGAQL